VTAVTIVLGKLPGLYVIAVTCTGPDYAYPALERIEQTDG
jgi:hypothetical protein